MHKDIKVENKKVIRKAVRATSEAKFVRQRRPGFEAWKAVGWNVTSAEVDVRASIASPFEAALERYRIGPPQPHFSFSLSVYLKVGHSRPPFLHFRFFNCYVKTTMFSIKLLMAGFKLVSNCVGSNCFAIFATTSWANASLRLPLLRAPWPKCLFPNCHQAVLYFSLNVWSHFDRFQIPANFENGHWTVKGISTSNLF